MYFLNVHNDTKEKVNTVELGFCVKYSEKKN